MPRTFDEITLLTRQMMKDRAPTIERMRQVLVRYENDIVITVPELPDEPTLPSLVPALIGEAIDKTAQRACSVEPMLFFPALNPMKEKGVRSLEYADIRKRAVQATCAQSRWDLGVRRAYRQLTAYATTSVLVYPDLTEDGPQMPRIQVRDPLCTFAETVAENDLRSPRYVAYVTRHTGAQLRRQYPQLCAEPPHYGPITSTRTDLMWDIVEWIDEEQIVVGLLGPAYDNTLYQMGQANLSYCIAEHPNRIEMMPTIVPSNISLARVISRMATLLGNVEWQNKLSTLDVEAQEKAIYPDLYIIGDSTQTPRLVNGQWQDGRSGVANIITDAKAVGLLHTTPDQRTSQTIDRMERNFRVSSGLNPQFGGESYGALRTGKAWEAAMQSSVDPNIQELHQVIESWLPQMHSAILATYKAYWPSKQYSMYSGRAGDHRLVEFTPKEHFEIFDNAVSYPVPGADVVATTQILGSMQGAKILSRKTTRAMHPWVADPDGEEREIREEEWETAFSSGLMMRVSQGAMEPMMAVMINDHIAKGEDWFDAVRKADAEARERQATLAPPAQPGQAIPPEAAPGLAPGGTLQQPTDVAPVEVQVPQGAEKIREVMSAMGTQ